MDEQPSPIKAIESAWKDMVAVLFSPFNLARWLILALPLFFVSCGNIGFNWNQFNVGGGYGEFVEIIDQNISMFAVLGAIAFATFVIFVLLATYLHSRGVFMLFSMLSTGVFDFGTSWARSSRMGNSFFLFQIVVLAIHMGFTVVYFYFYLGWPFIRQIILGEFEWAELWGPAIVYGIYFLLVGLPLWILTLVVRNFSLPVMAATNSTILPATRESFGLIASKPVISGSYFFFLFFIWLVGRILGTMVSLVLCWLLCLPIIGHYIVTFVFAPVLLFNWTYSLRFVEQFGERYKVLPDILGIPPAPPIPQFEGNVPPPAAYGPNAGGPSGSSGSWPPAPMPPPMPPEPPTDEPRN